MPTRMAERSFILAAGRLEKLKDRIMDVQPLERELSETMFWNSLSMLDNDLDGIVKRREVATTCKHENVRVRSRHIGYGRNRRIQTSRRCYVCGYKFPTETTQ